ncbi:MAG: hypothetical protein Q4P16_02890 [Spirochaetales bacterium]|nr:hypothetical protein [Spirochaetales bacterium]
MNGMEDLIIQEPEDKALEAMEKQQLVSVIIDQQKELNRIRGLLELEKKNCERFRNGYYMLAHFDWIITNERLKKEWRNAKITPPSDSSMKWVCSFGSVETAAFYDGECWWTEKHEKINVKVWQHLPHYSEKTGEDKECGMR